MREIDPNLAAQLAARYPEALMEQLRAELSDAPLPDSPAASVPYAHIQPLERSHERPLFYVPGFCEGIDAKLPFAAELAMRGYEVIMPGQDRRYLRRDKNMDLSPRYTQAYNHLAVIEAAVPPSQPVDLISHSMGSLVVEALVDQAPERLQDSRVVMLAPAGSIAEEDMFTLVRRWWSYIRMPEDGCQPAEFTHLAAISHLAGIKMILGHLPWTIAEVEGMARHRIDYSKLAASVGSLAVVTYAEDTLYPGARIAPTLERVINDSQVSHVTWAEPVSYMPPHFDHLTYGGQGAQHADEENNPSRVAGAVSQLLP